MVGKPLTISLFYVVRRLTTLWDYDPPPFLQIFVCMYLVLIPSIDDVLILFMGMFGGRMGGMYVPYGRDILQVHYNTCFRDNIGQTMFV